MNKSLPFIPLIFLISLCSCVKEQVQQHDQNLMVSVNLATVQTRTYLGESVANGRRQVYWSAGDAINVNGYESLPLTQEQSGKTTADFQLYNGSLPYRVIYPASVCGEFAADGTVTVNIPASQQYSPTSFGIGSAILYGYAESDETPVVLNNLCAAVKVTLNADEGKSISRALIISNTATAPVAGKFIIDPQTGEYSVSDGLTSVNLEIGQVALEGDGGQSFYFTIPYGTYPEGFTVKFYDSENFPMECRWLSNGENGVSVEAGKLYEFKPVDFVPGKKEILTGDDWLYIASCINKADDSWKSAYLDENTNTIKLGADIILPVGTPQITKDFTYVLDGKGYTLTNNNATASLIKTLPASGVIRNLRIAGKMCFSSATANVEPTAFVHTVSGGSIEDCTNEMTFDVTAKTAVFGAFARTITAGQIVRCANNADIDIKMDVKNATTEELKTIKSFGGGIVATCFNPTAVVLIEDCENNGDIDITIDVGEKAGVNRAGFAGVIGYVSGSTVEKYPKLINCTNKGSVQLSFADSQDKRAKVQYSVGGIVGLSAGVASSASGLNTAAISAVDSDKHGYIHLENCVNTGRVQNNAVSSCSSVEAPLKVYTGGIAGTLIGLSDNHAKIVNCINTGEVVPYSVKVNHYSRSGISSVCGGFLGLGAYVDIEGGTMNARIGTAESRSFAAAGVIGIAWSKFSIRNMSINANISMIQAKEVKHEFSNPDNHALAVTNYTSVIKTDLSGSEISGCRFAGSFLISCSGTYDSAPVIPTTTVYVKADDFPAGTDVVSKTYTKGGIVMENNTYWSNANVQ